MKSSSIEAESITMSIGCITRARSGNRTGGSPKLHISKNHQIITSDGGVDEDVNKAGQAKAGRPLVPSDQCGTHQHILRPRKIITIILKCVLPYGSETAGQSLDSHQESCQPPLTNV